MMAITVYLGILPSIQEMLLCSDSDDTIFYSENGETGFCLGI